MATMTKTATPQRSADADIERVQKGTFVLNLTMGSIRTRAQVKRETVEKMAAVLNAPDPTTLDEMSSDAADEVTVRKELLKVPEVRDIISEIMGIRALIRRSALPVRFLKNGLYLFSAMRLEWVEGQLSAAQARVDDLLAALEVKWDDIMADEQKRLEPIGLWDARDYVPLSKIREATRLRYSWLQFDVPQELQKLNPKLFAAERAKAKEAWREMYSQIRLGYAEVLQDFVRKFRAALAPEDGSKPKVLQQRTVDNLTAFLTSYRLDDVTNFTELASMVDGLKATMRGVDAEVLRTEDAPRVRIAAEMAKLDTDLAALVVEQQRKVRLRD